MRRLPLVRAACLAWLVLEILLVIWVGHQIGAGWTLLFLLAGVPLGIWVIQRAGNRSVIAIATSLRRGQTPTGELAQTGWAVVGGILLIIPGFIADFVAILVMMSPTRRLLVRAVAHFGPSKGAWVPPTSTHQGSETEPTVVRGDVV